jgi:hypothetical protein
MTEFLWLIGVVAVVMGVVLVLLFIVIFLGCMLYEVLRRLWDWKPRHTWGWLRSRWFLLTYHGDGFKPEKNHPKREDCPIDECLDCGFRDCVYKEPLHYHHDGCPACSLPPVGVTARDAPLPKEPAR